LTVGAAAALPPKDEVLSTPYKSDEATAQSHHDLTNLEDQVKLLQIDHNNHGDRLTVFSTTVDKLHQSVNEIEEQQKTDLQKNTERMEIFEKALVEIQTSNEYLKNQQSLTQRQLLGVQKSNEVLQTANTHLQNQLILTQQQFSDVQKNNDHLKDQLSLTQQQLTGVQKSNDYLKDQLSLTKQQLLGVQSMMTCSRLWVVSHDQFIIGKEIGRGAWATVHETTF